MCWNHKWIEFDTDTEYGYDYCEKYGIHRINKYKKCILRWGWISKYPHWEHTSGIPAPESFTEIKLLNDQCNHKWVEIGHDIEEPLIYEICEICNFFRPINNDKYIAQDNFKKRKITILENYDEY